MCVYYVYIMVILCSYDTPSTTYHYVNYLPYNVPERTELEKTYCYVNYVGWLTVNYDNFTQYFRN